MPQSHIPIHAPSRFKAPLQPLRESVALCCQTLSLYLLVLIDTFSCTDIKSLLLFFLFSTEIVRLFHFCPQSPVSPHHSPTWSTLSTQPLSSRAMPRRKGSRVSSPLSPLLPISSPPVLNDEYMQISRSLLGKDQYTIRLWTGSGIRSKRSSTL